ncbi:peptidoglycan-binding protein [Streptoverticillium reticulum]|uniref:peptidoglycan-binding protein n=1 Tax=Streptoverticillium reticulum TaxID=1433415 RepID=UPI0039BEF568
MDAQDDTATLPAVRDAAHTPDGGRPAAPSRRKKAATGTLVALAVLLTGGGVTYTWLRDRPAAEAPEGPGEARSVAVIRTDLGEQKTMAGTLGYGEATTVKGPGAGTVTWLPKAGETAERGKPLARIDDRPVTVFYGDMPLYRKLGQAPEPSAGASAKSSSPASGEPRPATTPSPGGAGDVAGPGTRGADVKILEENLYALGFRDFGRPDTLLTDATVTAVKRWQKANGDQHPSGVVDPADVRVIAVSARIGEIRAHVGDRADGELLTLTGGTRSVTVPLPVADKPLAPQGTKVTVDLPGGAKSTGTVRDVGTVAAQDGKTGSGGDGGGADSAAGDAKVKVTVSLDDPGAADGLDGAPVSVGFTSGSRTGVLAVPVGALVALREGGYAVQVTGQGAEKPHLTSVKTGMFAQGLVEVSGPEIKEGVRVVTAQ